jgi:threonine synthase
MPAELRCFNAQCGARYAMTAVLYNCEKCGALLEASYDFDYDPAELKKLFRERRMSNAPLDASGVW